MRLSEEGLIEYLHGMQFTFCKSSLRFHSGGDGALTIFGQLSSLQEIYDLVATLDHRNQLIRSCALIGFSANTDSEPSLSFLLRRAGLRYSVSRIFRDESWELMDSYEHFDEAINYARILMPSVEVMIRDGKTGKRYSHQICHAWLHAEPQKAVN